MKEPTKNGRRSIFIVRARWDNKKLTTQYAMNNTIILPYAINPQDPRNIGQQIRTVFFDHLHTRLDTNLPNYVEKTNTQRADALRYPAYFNPEKLDPDQRRVVANVIAGHSVIVHGLPGTGKSTVAKVIINQLRESRHIHVVSAMAIVAKGLDYSQNSSTTTRHKNSKQPKVAYNVLSDGYEKETPYRIAWKD